MGDTATISSILGDYQSDLATTQKIAATLLLSAQATAKAGNAAGGGVLAALALISGGLTNATDAGTAADLASASPTATALITGANFAALNSLLTGGGLFTPSYVNAPGLSPSQSSGSPS